jgi:4-amino-4-deoxychorismate lyase
VSPALTRAGVAGVVRGTLIAAFRAAGVAVVERDLELAELETASEVFVTNSLIGVWPVRGLEAWRWPLGPRTRQAAEWARGW